MPLTTVLNAPFGSVRMSMAPLAVLPLRLSAEAPSPVMTPKLREKMGKMARDAAKAVNYIGARDERAAAHMADAYARITGGPGVVLGPQAGPGAANLVTGLAEALLAYSPLVAVAGMVPREHLGRDTFQEVDQQALFAPVSKRSFVVPTAERLPDMLHEALRLAMSGRRGPVVLNVPRDLFAAPCTPGVRARSACG